MKKIIKKGDKHGFFEDVGKLVFSLIIAFIIFYFLGITNDSILLQCIVSIFAFLLFFFSWKKYGLFYFMLSLLTSVFVFLALEISFNLGLFVNFILALAVTMLVLHIYCKRENDDCYAWILFGLFVLLWIIIAFNVKYRDGWELENYLTVPFVIILLLVSKWFKFSKTSYILLFVFMTLHTIGGHYTYAEVPFGDWIKEFLGLGRNHYDRIVHFSFGFLLAYPVREVFVRIAGSKGIWSLWLPVELVFGLSAIYEIVEWAAAVIWGGDLGIAFLGSQGDIWDAQKDMALAGSGAIIAMLITGCVRFASFGKIYWKEINDSFKVRGKVLGERALEKN